MTRSNCSSAYGDADRRWGIANTPDTRFATASGTKGLTALAVVTLIEDGTLDRGTTARSLLGGDLPLVDDAVTVEQLLAHRSGIGDYLDEDTDVDLNDYLMPVPVHRLVDTEDFVAVLDGYPDEVPARRAVLLLQRRLHGARPDRRAGLGRAVPRARRPARVCTSRDARHRVPALRRAARADRGRLPRTSTGTGAATSSTSRSVATATAGSTPRSLTFGPCGRRCSPVASSRWSGSTR